MEQTKEFCVWKRIITIVIMAVLWLVCVYPLYLSTNSRKTAEDEYILNEGWQVSINGEVHSNVTLEDFTFPVTQKGDVIIIRKRIPLECNVENPCLSLLSVHSTIELALDKKVFYTYGLDRQKEGLLVGYGKSTVPMPEDYVGRELRVTLNVTEDNAFEGLQALSIVNANTYFENRVLEGRFGMFVSLFLIGFGSIAMLLSPICYWFNKSIVQVFCLAFFSFLAGVWTLCNDGLIEIIVPSIVIRSYFEYMSLYLAPLPLTYYLSDRIEENICPKWLKRFFWGLILLEVVFAVSAIVLQLTNLVHFPKLLAFNHLILALTVVYFCCFAFNYIRRAKKVRKSVIIGFSIVASISVIELIMFYLRKYMIGFKDNTYSGSLFLIAFIIVLTLFFDYMERMHGAVYEAAQKKILEAMAYMDELTNLANRRKIEDSLIEHVNGEKTYAVVSMDMNSLKYINDTFGHEMGDLALKRIADCLVEVFTDSALIGRMGGDEFALITDELSEEALKNHFIEFELLLGAKPLEHTGVFLSCSYGYAYSYECHSEQGDAHEIYRLADARMYEMKRKSKIS